MVRLEDDEVVPRLQLEVLGKEPGELKLDHELVVRTCDLENKFCLITVI